MATLDTLGGAVSVISLDDPRAADPSLVGGKAAALARARRAGFDVPAGEVITTAAVARVDAAGGDLTPLDGMLDGLWRRMSSITAPPVALAVRSSSPAEDSTERSMAGRFESVLGVAGERELRSAVTTVLTSRRRASEGDGSIGAEDPIAVLVQPLIDAGVGGVLFGFDPVTGREDRIVVVAAHDGAPAVVRGDVAGTRYELDRRGRLVSREDGDGGADLRRSQLRRLVKLALRGEGTFGGPQDIEWAEDRAGRLWLLQSRPVTTAPAGVPEGPVLGVGPVAETFPEPLSRLEQELWIPPLRKALEESFRLSGLADDRRLGRSPLLVCVHGTPAVDLELMGEVMPAGWRARIDPRPRWRRLQASWRVGRLRAALAGLAMDLLDRADAQLQSVPPLEELTNRQLVALLRRAAPALAALHGHEILIGLLVRPEAAQRTSASVALRLLAHARAEGLSDDDIALRYPTVLVLTPPAVRPAIVLPRPVEAPEWSRPTSQEGEAVVREALRLRIRWVHELTARAAWELGERLVAAGLLDDPSTVRDLTLAELEAAVHRHVAPRPAPAEPGPGRPLPTRFRLTDRGVPVAVRAGDTGGTGAGGGRGRGPVAHDPDDVPEGAVLVVGTLDPTIAPVLPRLAGLVSETGSALSHVAILAREAGIPTVVGFADARERLAEGTVVEVDGATGEVR